MVPSPWISQLIDWFFPPVCVHCGREGAWLCGAAMTELQTQAVLLDPVAVPGLDRVIVRGSYDCPTLSQLIQKLKYQYWTGLQAVIGTVLEPVVGELLVDRATMIVPVPLHRRRRRERGFNQSLLIGRGLSSLVQIPVAEVLCRNRYTTPQAGLPERQRLTNIIGAFDQHSRVAKAPQSVILVDDVITTGSTMAECAGVLRQHGVKTIMAVALAKG